LWFVVVCCGFHQFYLANLLTMCGEFSPHLPYISFCMPKKRNVTKEKGHFYFKRSAKIKEAIRCYLPYSCCGLLSFVVLCYGFPT